MGHFLRDTLYIFNRPGVAGAVLQTPPFLGLVGPFGTIFDCLGPFGTLWDHIGHFVTISDRFGPF